MPMRRTMLEGFIKKILLMMPMKRNMLDQEDGHGHVDEEFNHGLTLDQSEKYYWSFSVQQWFPLAMNENGDFYWNYPEQTWSRFK